MGVDGGGAVDADLLHQLFSDISGAVLARCGAADIARLVLDVAGRLAPAERGAVGVWAPGGDAFQVLAVTPASGAPGLTAGETIAVDDSGPRALPDQRPGPGSPVRHLDRRRRSTAITRLLKAGGLRSALVVPVSARGEQIGFLAVSARRAGAFSVGHERALARVAEYLAFGLEQARLTAEARLHQARLLGLQRVAQRLAASVTVDDALDIVLDEAVRSVGGDSGTLLAWDEQRRVLTPLRNTVSTAELFTALRPGEGVAGRAIERMQVTVLHDYQREAGDETPAGSAGVRAAIGAPLVHDGQLLGAVTTNTLDPARRFDAADMQIFDLYAGQAAAALFAVRRFEHERRQRRGAEEAARAAAVVVSDPQAPGRLDVLVERAVKIVGASMGSLILRMTPAEPLRAVATVGGVSAPMSPGPRPGSSVDTASTLLVAAQVMAQRGAVLAAGGPAQVSHIGVPVVVGGELLGALIVVTEAGRRPLSDDDVTLIQLVADLAAVALDHVRSHEREQQRQRQLEAVRSVTAELTRELDLPSLLALILERTSEFARCESAAVLLWDEESETLVPTAWRGLGDWVANARLALGEGAAGTAALRRGSVLVEDYRTWSGAYRPDGDDASPRSVMAVPMTHQERMIGVLTANRHASAEPFTHDDLELLEVFAVQAAIAIENARLFEQATTVEALRELAQLKAELLNTVSHELRTPLSLIHGYSELLMHRADRLSPADVAQMSGEIYASSKTLARLVDDLLDFSHLEHGRLELRTQRLDLGEMLTALAHLFRAQPGGERIVTDLQAGIQVDADPDRLHQVVGNLLSNALAYTTDGAITIRSRREANLVRVEVEDHGPGLLPEEVGRVWESFYRGAEAANLPNRGSGLGLTVVKQLVELHGGKVGVRSAPGQGATFWFTLPAV